MNSNRLKNMQYNESLSINNDLFLFDDNDMNVS